MRYSVAQLAQHVGGQVEGNPETLIAGPADISTAREQEISFLANSKYFPYLQSTKAGAIVLEKSVPCARKELTLIRVEKPNLAFAKIIALFAPKPVQLAEGIDALAVVSKSAKVGKGVRIGPFVFVGERAEIGDHAQIFPGCYIGPDSRIGSQALLYPHVTVRECVQIGDRVIIHPGVVVGSDGFGFELVKGKWEKVPQTGTVEIGEDVELGANTTIDRARFGKTQIGHGSKFDNQVHVGHNVVIGHDSILVAQVGVSGSASIGHHVVIAGQAGVGGHVHIGDGARIAGQSGATSDVPAGAEMGGTPVVPFSDWVKTAVHLKKLGEYAAKIKKLSKRVEELEKKLGVKP